MNNPIRSLLLMLLLLMPAVMAGAADDGDTLHTASVSTASQPEDDTSGKEVPKFDLDQLIERLKKTEAIGFLTKLAIRSDVLDFRDRIERYRQQKRLPKHLPELRDRFDGLLLKIMALLEDDPRLAHAIYAAREQIWTSLLEVKT